MQPHVMRGDPFRPTAEQWNRALIAGDAEFARSRDRLSEDTSPPPCQQTTATVKNMSGEDLEAFSAVALGAGIIGPEAAPTGNLVEFQSANNFTAFKCAAAGTADVREKMGILLEPIANNEFGLCAISGVVACQVYVANGSTNDQFANLTPGETYLTSNSARGAVEILYKESGTGAVKWALVRIGTVARPTNIVQIDNPLVLDAGRYLAKCVRYQGAGDGDTTIPEICLVDPNYHSEAPLPGRRYHAYPIGTALYGGIYRQIYTIAEPVAKVVLIDSLTKYIGTDYYPCHTQSRIAGAWANKAQALFLPTNFPEDADSVPNLQRYDVVAIDVHESTGMTIYTTVIRDATDGVSAVAGRVNIGEQGFEGPKTITRGLTIEEGYDYGTPWRVYARALDSDDGAFVGAQWGTSASIAMLVGNDTGFIGLKVTDADEVDVASFGGSDSGWIATAEQCVGGSIQMILQADGTVIFNLVADTGETVYYAINGIAGQSGTLGMEATIVGGIITNLGTAVAGITGSVP